MRCLHTKFEESANAIYALTLPVTVSNAGFMIALASAPSGIQSHHHNKVVVCLRITFDR